MSKTSLSSNNFSILQKEIGVYMSLYYKRKRFVNECLYVLKLFN